jgi:integrase
MARPSKGGAHKTSKTLADGSKRDYWYAWPGGPPLKSPPGTREFDRELKQHIAARDSGRLRPAALKAGKTLVKVVDAYLDSPEFLSRAERTQSDYRKLLKLVVDEFGDLPLIALQENDGREARGGFLRWRNGLAKQSSRQADYAWTVLNIVLNWAKVIGDIKLNPCREAGVKKLYNGTRKDKVWSPAQIGAFLAHASPELQLAMNLALWTGQRQGDLLQLVWPAYDGRTIRLVQNKGDVPIVLPVAAPLREALDAARRRNLRVLVNQDGDPWTPDGFRVMWRKTCVKAGVAGVTFHDLRGTAVTRLALAGCTEPQIVSITGHTMSRVKSILEANYLHRDPRLAQDAIAKLEAWQASESANPNRSQPIDFFEAKKVRFGELSQ